MRATTTLHRMNSYFKSNVVTRMLSTSANVPRVCIVGAGAAGFYAAMHLAKNLANVKIDLLEKLPVPFGLVR